MTEYTSKETAKEIVFDKIINNIVEDQGMYGYLVHLVNEAFDEAPAADVRPVVLCKDCKYYFKDVDGYEMCENSEGYDHVSEDGFCAWAVKREKS